MTKTAEKTPAPPHDLILEGRSKLTVTGVKRVLRCDADSAAMETGKGVLHLTGAELNVTSLDLESGEVRLTGRIDALEYTAERTPGGLLLPCLHWTSLLHAYPPGGMNFILLLEAAAFRRNFRHPVNFHIRNTTALRIIVYPARNLYSFIIVVCSLRYRVHVFIPFAISFPLPVTSRFLRVDFPPVLPPPAVWASL